MKSRQIIAIVLFLIAAVILVWWLAEGHHPFTTTQRMVQVKDELFGTTTEKWEPHFTPGLEYFGPIIAVFTAVGIWLLVRGKKKVTR